MSVLFQPTGFIVNAAHPMMYFVRIYTTLSSVGQIQMDNVTISALLYHRIAQTDFYWYENETTNDTHRISALDSSVTYSVRYFIHSNLLNPFAFFRLSVTHTVMTKDAVFRLLSVYRIR